MNTPLLAAANAAARFGLIALLSLGTLSAQTPAIRADAKKDDAVKIEKFEVTGSRIKRLDYETPAPVETFTIQEIEAKGYVNIGDFLQSLPFNSGTANSIYQTASFQRGAATANIRGLGAQRSLTLVNGRRAVPYALQSPNSGTRSVFDFNSLPSAAIESIELLKDGASSLYGSDAITGVLNIKLKKNFSGLSASLYYGNTLKKSGGDTGVKQVSIVAGVGSGKTKMMTAIDAKTANSNFLRDYGVTTTDYSYLGTNKGLNQNSTFNWPANLTLTRAQAAAVGVAFPNVAATVTSWTYVINGGKPTATPTLGSFVAAPANPAAPTAVLVGNENRYDFAQSFQVYPAYDYISNYTSFEHEFNDSVKAFGSVMFSKNSTYYAFTPGVIQYATEGLTLPATNPYNPFGIPLTTLAARASFQPVRKFDTESTAGNFLAGLKGTVFSSWEWESGVSYGFGTVSTVSRNAIRATTYQAALNGTTRQTALNPFGPGDNPAIAAGLATVSADSHKADSITFDASAAGKLFQLPAGDMGIAFGVEARNDRLTTNPDTSAYLGSGSGLPLSGKRTVTSQFVEITVPLYKKAEFGSAELQLAGRREHYSDFGNTTKPKVAAKIRLPDNRYVTAILRGSYSESFAAPPLGLLYASQTISFTQGLTQDPLRLQDPPTQLRNVAGGNPNLLPETAKVQFVGTVIEFPKIRNLSFNVDFFNIRINQFIVSPSTAFLLTPNGIAQFPNAIVRDTTLGNPGPILRIESVPQNNPRAYQLYRGIDFGGRYAVRNTRTGSYTFSAAATQIIKVGTDSGLGSGFFNNAGYYYNPRWKAQASTAWNYKDYGASVTVDHIGHWYNDGYTVQGWGENPFNIVGLQLRYAGFWGTNLSIGASNLLNQRPPPNGRQSIGFDPNAYGAGVLGRFISIRIRKDY